MSTDTSASERRLAAVEGAVHALNDTLPHEQSSAEVVRIVQRALRAQAVALFYSDREHRHLTLDHIRGRRDTRIRGMRVLFGEGVAGTSARRARVVHVPDASREKRFEYGFEERAGLRPGSLVAVPLVHRGDVIGVMEVMNQRGRRAFTSEDAALAALLAEPLTAAIAHGRVRQRSDRIELEYSLFKKVAQSMGRSITGEEVLQRIVRNLHRLIPFDAAAVFVLERGEGSIRSVMHEGYPRGADERIQLKIDEGVVGLAASQRRGVIVDDVRENPSYVNARGRTRSELVAPMVTRDRVIGLFNLESDHVRAYDRSHLRLLEAFAGIAAVSIERAFLYEEQKEKEEIQEELRLARTVQEFFTPRKSISVGKYRVAGANFPSLEVSGDYYDFFPVKAGLTAFAIADVAGKGVPASLIMSGLRATLHTVAPYTTSARQIAVRANEILGETVRPEDFVTAFFGVIDPANGAVSYCNCGHNPPILLAPDGGYRLLETGGPVLGVFEEPPLQEGRFRLGDDVLVCYTDGATEIRNGDDEEYGDARLIASVRGNAHLTPYRLGRALFADLRAFVGSARQSDDVTYLVIRRRG